MLGFNELNEVADNVYEYNPARSTATSKYYVITSDEMKQDVVCAFTYDADVADRRKKIWFGTVSAMRGKKGGFPIIDMGNPEVLANTVADLLKMFQLSYKANAILLRVHKKGSGRMWDVRLKQALRKLRLPTDSTSVLEVGDSAKDVSYFVITRPGFDASSVLSGSSEYSHLQRIASMMSVEKDPATVRNIVMTIDDLTYDASPKSIETWVIDNPPMKVPAKTRYTIESQPSELPRIVKSNEDRIKKMTRLWVDKESSTEKQAAIQEYGDYLVGANSMIGMDPLQIANKLLPKTEEMNTKIGTKLTGGLTKTYLLGVSRYIEEQYKSLPDANRSLAQTEALRSYCQGEMYVKLNTFLFEGTEPENISDKYRTVLQGMDSMYAEHGMDMGDVRPKTRLYRGVPMEKNQVLKMLRRGTFASTAYMSASISPLVAVGFSEESHNQLVVDKHDRGDVIELLENSKSSSCAVVFIIEPDGVPVINPGGAGYPDECEFIINRGTVFAAEYIRASVNDNGTVRVTVRLKLKRHTSYTESVIDFYNDDKELMELIPLAQLLEVTSTSGEDWSENKLEKHNSPVL